MQVQEASSVFAPVYSLNVTAQYRSLFGEGTLFGSCHIIIAVVVTVVALPSPTMAEIRILSLRNCPITADNVAVARSAKGTGSRGDK